MDATFPSIDFPLIDAHAHMVSRTTNDYEAMKRAGIVALIEPAFWLGQPRTELGTFKDYFSTLVGFERFRASQFGIKHYCTIGLNSKEANNEKLAEQVIDLLPLYACKEGVVGIGEIGFDDQSKLEDKYFRIQVDLAKEVKLPVQVHTPHRDKKNGTLRSMKLCKEQGIEPHWVIIDHNNEGTVKEVLDEGFWAAFTIYPHTKMSSDRMVEIIKKYGSEKIIINSATDWGISDPLAVPKTAQLMLDKGIPKHDVIKVCYSNAILAFGQSGQMHESDIIEASNIDQRLKFSGNTVLRGGQDPKVGSTT
jgi:hypothetical protein